MLYRHCALQTRRADNKSQCNRTELYLQPLPFRPEGMDHLAGSEHPCSQHAHGSQREAKRAKLILMHRLNNEEGLNSFDEE